MNNLMEIDEAGQYEFSSELYTFEMPNYWMDTYNEFAEELESLGYQEREVEGK